VSLAKPIPATRYSTVAIALHWTIAAAILFQILIAWRFVDQHTPLAFALTQLHKSIGITVLLLSLLRLGWRIAHNPPEVAGLATWERLLSRAVHLGFYVIMIGMPLTGWIMVSTSRTAIPTLLYGVMPWPHLPVLATAPDAAKHAWHTFGVTGHEVLAWGAYGLILLHVAGALKHQLFDARTPVLARMAPGAKAGRGFDPRLIAIGLGALVILGLGQVYRPPPPAAAPLPPAAALPPEPPELTDKAAPPVTPTAAAPAAQAAVMVDKAPVRWAVSPGSTLGFTTTWGGQEIQGRFDRWTADILFSPQALDRSRVSVSIDPGKVATGDAQRDASIPGADWFDAATHPRASFVAEKFEKTGEGRYVAHGKLTLRGVTRPVDLPFRLKIDGDKARMSGVTSLDRTAFGVGQGEWQATDQIPAKVKVSVQIAATRR
jgi:polyisoprenoid-binding protein YceI/cytochrome b561